MTIKLQSTLLTIQLSIIGPNTSRLTNTIKEKLHNEQICIPFMKTGDQLVNLFTKGLCSPNFNKNVIKLSMHNIHIPA